MCNVGYDGARHLGTLTEGGRTEGEDKHTMLTTNRREVAASASFHAVLEGTAVPGSTVELRKHRQVTGRTVGNIKVLASPQNKPSRPQPAEIMVVIIMVIIMVPVAIPNH